MNNKLITAIILPVLLTLGIQAYMLFRLNTQVYFLSGQINQISNLQSKSPTFSTFSPANPYCDNKLFDNRAEALRATSEAY